MRNAVFIISSAAVLVFGALPASAHHFNRGYLVRAYRPCDAADANTVSSGGIPACSPPVPLSDCKTDPAGALVLAANGRTSFLMRPKGRRRTRHNDGKPAIDTRVLLAGVERCDGSSYTGSLTARVVMRLHGDDPHCNEGRCTLPDITYTHTFDCSRGRCRLYAEANAALAAQDLPPLPSTYSYTIDVLGLSVLDQAGQPFLTAGISAGEALMPQLAELWHLPRWIHWLDELLPVRNAHAYGASGAGAAKRLLARYTRSFAECPEESVDTETGDGRAACTSEPLSSCAADPDNAVVPYVPPIGNFVSDTKGRGKVEVSVGNGTAVKMGGYLRTLETCEGGEYNGTLTAAGTFRTTLHDPACAGGECTLIDSTLFSAVIDVQHGNASLSGVKEAFTDLDALVGSSGMTAEVLRVRFLDRSGNSALEGPSLLIRCNPVAYDGSGFCFGN